VVTGSSSKLLPGEIATSLRGRALTKIVYPLGFREFLKFKGFKAGLPESLPYSPRKPKILNFFNEFLEYGGFPQVVLSDKKEEFFLRTFLNFFSSRMLLSSAWVRQKIFLNRLDLSLQNQPLLNIYSMQSRPFLSLKFPYFPTP